MKSTVLLTIITVTLFQFTRAKDEGVTAAKPDFKAPGRRLSEESLGLAALPTTQNSTVLQRFPAILLNLTEVLNDNSTYVDGLVTAPGSQPASPLERRGGGAARWVAAPAADTPHEAHRRQRRRRLAAGNAARALDLRAATHHQLETLKGQVGPETFALLLQATNQDTLQQIREYMPL